MSFVSLKNGPSFGEDRLAYIYAISRRESSSNLSLSDTVRPNLQARNVHNGKIAGYGLPLDAAIKRIISYRIQSKHGDGAISLKKYLEDYKQIQKEIEKICIPN